jgi:hypothetical protein
MTILPNGYESCNHSREESCDRHQEETDGSSI